MRLGEREVAKLHLAAASDTPQAVELDPVRSNLPSPGEETALLLQCTPSPIAQRKAVNLIPDGGARAASLTARGVLVC